MALKPNNSRFIGVNIRRAREEAGMTQNDVAHKLGYTGPTAGAYISRLESGQRPRIDTLAAIARILGVHVEDLLAKPRKH